MTTLLALTMAPMMVLVADAQTEHAQPLPSFEVAAVKRSTTNTVQSPEARKRGWGYETGRVALLHITLKSLIYGAFDVQPYQIMGPAWMGTEFYDVFANVPSGSAKGQIPLMFQQLLADRFKMQCHRETRAEPVYALVVAKGGPQLKEALPGDGGDTWTGDGAFGKVRITRSGSGPYSAQRHEFESMSTASLAKFLTLWMFDLPVLDMTKLTESYRITLDLQRPASMASVDQPDSVVASLQKLGLKLVRQTGPVERLVIDHIEKTPTEN